MSTQCRKARARWRPAIEALSQARAAYECLRELANHTLSLEDEAFEASGREAANLAETEAFFAWWELHPNRVEADRERLRTLRSLDTKTADRSYVDVVSEPPGPQLDAAITTGVQTPSRSASARCLARRRDRVRLLQPTRGRLHSVQPRARYLARLGRRLDRSTQRLRSTRRAQRRAKPRRSLRSVGHGGESHTRGTSVPRLVRA